MYKLFFDNKIITFTQKSTDDAASVDSQHDFDAFQIAKVLQKVDNSNLLEIISENPAELFRRFCANFRCVEAAGGAVVSGGRLLMIFRNKRWDLPKGHMEQGESREVCAVREVEEECGITTPTITRYLTSTRHIYRMHEQWYMKLTHWYEMSLVEPTALKPQTEEGIEIAQWVEMSDVEQRLENSYSTIKEVIWELRVKN